MTNVLTHNFSNTIPAMRPIENQIENNAPAPTTSTGSGGDEIAANEPDAVIRLCGVSKVYNLYANKRDRLKEALHPGRKEYHRRFFALKNINLKVKRGEVLGIVGRNGCGKSTLLKLISKVLTPTIGSVWTKGSIVALLELGSGFNPEFTGMENIYFYCSLLGYRKHETDQLVDEILEFADIGYYINQPIKTYSSGMKARLSFAVSVNVDPDILILDEVLAVGDELFRRKCYAKMDQFFKGGKTILFVSHSVATINQLCTRAVLLDEGEILLEGPTKLVTRNYNMYLHAKKENKAAIKAEIIALNKDEKVKQAIYQQIAIDEEEVSSGEDWDDSALNQNDMASRTQYGHEELEKTFAKEPYYIPDFTPSTTEVFKNEDIDISDIKITTLDGKQVNCLVRGETYYYEFFVRSNTEAENINISASVLTEKNILISNFGWNRKKPFISKLHPSDTYKVKIRFKCNINSGTYYTGIAVLSYINSELNLLSRIADALVFKVLPEEDKTIGGLVTLEQDIFIEKK
ncbi:MAG: ABC transporter ATP-binding protein [Desulfobacteraceae bacterium]|nr:MAG: ABC transporter ATP-binding protein [Desulfobacteraceae bacterium]